MGAEQSAATDGNGPTGPAKNEDKRTARLQNKNSFMGAIEAFRMAQPANIGILSTGSREDACEGIHVCVRKRPLFEHEVAKGDYDATTVVGGSQIVVHDGRMKPDMRTMFMKHQTYSFDRVFDETTSSGTVYAGTAGPLVRRALQGGVATVFMFGQTGSGKTYTMSAIHKQAAHELFDSINAQMESGDEEITVGLTYVELAGSACRDMLNDGAEVLLQANQDGDYEMRGAAEVTACDAEELLDAINTASAKRATCATGVHDQSSRTHAVCRISIHGGCGGMFTMVDLAGTERQKDSMTHDSKLQKETAEINSSLMALKECVRQRNNGAKHINFRASLLTKMLRSCFVQDSSGVDACTVVIATVSPSSGDTEHTLCTLQHSSLMDGQNASAASSGPTHIETVDVLSQQQILAQQAKASAPKEPKKWTADDCSEWWERAADKALKKAGKGHLAPPRLQSSLSGKDLVRWPQNRFELAIGDPKAGAIVFKFFKDRMEKAENLRLDMVALRAGRSSTGGSTPRGGTTPRNGGTPGSIRSTPGSVRSARGSIGSARGGGGGGGRATPSSVKRSASKPPASSSKRRVALGAPPGGGRRLDSVWTEGLSLDGLEAGCADTPPPGASGGGGGGGGSVAKKQDSSSRLSRPSPRYTAGTKQQTATPRSTMKTPRGGGGKPSSSSSARLSASKSSGSLGSASRKAAAATSRGGIGGGASRIPRGEDKSGAASGTTGGAKPQKLSTNANSSSRVGGTSSARAKAPLMEVDSRRVNQAKAGATPRGGNGGLTKRAARGSVGARGSVSKAKSSPSLASTPRNAGSASSTGGGSSSQKKQQQSARGQQKATSPPPVLSSPAPATGPSGTPRAQCTPSGGGRSSLLSGPRRVAVAANVTPSSSSGRRRAAGGTPRTSTRKTRQQRAADEAMEYLAQLAVNEAEEHAVAAQQVEPPPIESAELSPASMRNTIVV